MNQDFHFPECTPSSLSNKTTSMWWTINFSSTIWPISAIIQLFLLNLGSQVYKILPFTLERPFTKQPTNSFLQIISVFFFPELRRSPLSGLPNSHTLFFNSRYVPTANGHLITLATAFKYLQTLPSRPLPFQSPLPWWSLRNQTEGAISFQTTSTPSHTTSVSLSQPSLPEDSQWRSKWHQTTYNHRMAACEKRKGLKII